jgi:hypothetical protein
VNGQLVSATPVKSPTPPPLEKLTLGSPAEGTDADSRDYFNGSLDELMIFKRVLSENEINRIYKAGGSY